MRTVQKEQSDAEDRVAKEKRNLTKLQAENKLKIDKLQFKISQQTNRVNRNQTDIDQINKHIELRRSEK